MSARRLLLSLAVTAALAVAACGDPPDKEIQQAQGAIDTARAAGADQYAQTEFAAAEDALKRAHEAVAQRDYRLALNNALDARERALAAAKESADRKTTARADAERELLDAMTALNEMHAKARGAEASHVPPKLLLSVRRVITDSEDAVQKARAAFDTSDYLTVIASARETKARLKATAQEVDAATGGTPAAAGERAKNLLRRFSGKRRF
jgi:hypothetical protein